VSLRPGRLVRPVKQVGRLRRARGTPSPAGQAGRGREQGKAGPTSYRPASPAGRAGRGRKSSSLVVPSPNGPPSPLPATPLHCDFPIFPIWGSPFSALLPARELAIPARGVGSFRRGLRLVETIRDGPVARVSRVKGMESHGRAADLVPKAGSVD